MLSVKTNKNLLLFLLIMPVLVGACCTEDLTLVLFKYCSLCVTLQNGCCLYFFQLFAAWCCWLGYSKFINRVQQQSPVLCETFSLSLTFVWAPEKNISFV